MFDPQIFLTTVENFFPLPEPESGEYVSGTKWFFPCIITLLWDLNIFPSTSVLLTGDFYLSDLNVNNKGLGMLIRHCYEKQIRKIDNCKDQGKKRNIFSKDFLVLSSSLTIPLLFG